MSTLDAKMLKCIRENGPATPEELAGEVDIGGVYSHHVDRCVAASEWFVYDDDGRVHLSNKVRG